MNLVIIPVKYNQIVKDIIVMISKIRSFQDTWLVKGILLLTALSFMSLFGISGYISQSGANRPIVRVDNIEITQDEINHQLNEQISLARKFLGDETEISDTTRNAMLQEIVQNNLVNAIMQKTAEDNSVVISNELIRKIIYSQPEFMNASGQFDLDKMRRILSLSGNSEAKYIAALKRDIIKQHLVQTPVMNMPLATVMDPYLAQVDSQRKIFEYVVIDPNNLKIDRKISEEELQQYYQDFAPQFEEAESRDISFVEFSIDKLSQKISPSDEDIAAYYQENIDSFVVPENRYILQMVFQDKDTADKAEAALNAGGDFFKVAKDIAKQDRTSTDLGNVSQDMLIGDLAEAVFALKKGDYTSPIKTGMGWHIMKVITITPKKETTLAAAKAKIIADIQKELAYDQAQEVMAEIEDKIGAGATFEEIAKEYNANISKVAGLKEDGSAKSVTPTFKNLVSSSDFVETAFSYNQGEISQVMETDMGFAILKIEKINDAHQKDISKVRNEIEKMWAESEKSAIAQEIVNDVSHDLEEGDKFADVARRFELSLKTTSPLKRGEAFAKLNPSQLNDIYHEKIGNPRIIATDKKIIIVMPSKIVRGKSSVSAEKIDALRAKAKAEISQELANDLIDAYASNYKVRVKYKYLGL